jgi:mono/diheme cytochrome c family protein
MKLRILAFLMVVLAFCTCTKQPSAPSSEVKTPSGPAATPDPFAAARGMFAKDCQLCHGPDGKGGPVKLEDGTKLKVPSLREGHALRHPDSDFLKQIKEGGDGMPAFKDKLSRPQIDEMIRFIRQEFQGGQKPPSEARP